MSDSTESPTCDQLSRSEQRDIVRKAIEFAQDLYFEGSVVAVVSKEWLDVFFSGDESLVMPPINNRGIAHKNYIVAHADGLATVPCEVYEMFVSWFGTKDGSEMVSVSLINERDELVPELVPLEIQVHLLSTTPTSTSSRVHRITVSRLCTLDDMKEKVSQMFPSQCEKPARLWVVEVGHMHNEIHPSTFMAIQKKFLLRGTGRLKDITSDTVANNKGSSNNGENVNNNELTGVHFITLSTTLVQLVVEFKDENWPSHFYHFNQPVESDGCTGLQNLGNTCYMNSALQCLTHIPELANYFRYNVHTHEINRNNPLGSGGRVAESFASLCHSLYDKKFVQNKSFSPREFKTTIGYYNSMFAGYHQQDSQEFIAYLLDGLHEDLNRIIVKPQTEKLELDSHNSSELRDLAVRSWEQHKLRNDSIVVDLFVGQYKSTVTCPVCSKVSITFDPYNDLTLPIPVHSTWKHKVLVFFKDRLPQYYTVELPKKSTFADLKTYVQTKLQVKNLVGAEVFNHQFYSNYQSPESHAQFLTIGDLISAGDVAVLYELPDTIDGDLIVPVLQTRADETRSPVGFGIPFFIVVGQSDSPDDIRRKLEDRYNICRSNPVESGDEEMLDANGETAESSDAPESSKTEDNNSDDVLSQGSLDLAELEADESSIPSKDLGAHAFSIKVYDESPTPTDEIWTPSHVSGFSLPLLQSELIHGQALVCEWNREFPMFEYSEIPNSLPQQQTEAGPITLDQCLRLFSKPEVLGSMDSWYCPSCKEHREATKQLQLWSTPDILTVHLKRFENQRSFSDKIEATVDFPITGLDMSPYLAGDDSGSQIYDLFAVDNHFGGLGGGHYTAYAKNFVDNEWYYYDDSRVTKADPMEAIKGSAYLLFYRRRGAPSSSLKKTLDSARKQYEAYEQNVCQAYEEVYLNSLDDGEPLKKKRLLNSSRSNTPLDREQTV